MLPELVPSGCMPMTLAVYMFEVVKKCKFSLHAQDQVSALQDHLSSGCCFKYCIK